METSRMGGFLEFGPDFAPIGAQLLAANSAIGYALDCRAEANRNRAIPVFPLLYRLRRNAKLAR